VSDERFEQIENYGFQEMSVTLKLLIHSPPANRADHIVYVHRWDAQQ